MLFIALRGDDITKPSNQENTLKISIDGLIQNDLLFPLRRLPCQKSQ